MPPEDSLTSESDRESVLCFNDVFTKHRRNSTGPKYICSYPECNQKFKRLDNLDQHLFRHTGVKKHACTHEDCFKVYSTLTHLKRHIRTTHDQLRKPEKNVPCTIEDCDKMFQSICNMQRHLREVHENPKVYPCLYCEEKFTQKLKLRRHEITKHTGEYPFNCEKCSKGFYQQWHYEKHVPSCKVYYCPNCSERFDKWTTYLKHCKDKQHGRKYYKCEHCTRVYAKPGQLQQHIIAKHVEGDLAMTFKCAHEGCQRVYSYERNLRQHVKVAHSGKRFECEEDDCKRCFSSAQNLAKHVKRDHTLNRNEGNKCNSNEEKLPIAPAKPQRKKRKDAGCPKQSNLACLSGISVERQFDKLLRERDSDALATASAELMKSTADENVCSETECVAPKKFCNNSIQQLENFITTPDLPKKGSDFAYLNNDEGELSNMLALILQE